MVYRHFRLLCVVRVALLCATTNLFFYLLSHTDYYATLLIVGTVILYQTYALIGQVSQ